MKKLFTLATLSALALALPVSAFAKAKAAAQTAPTAPAATAKNAAEKPMAAAADAVKATKPIPMYVKVDAIDAATKTLSHTKVDGVVVKNVVTATTEIKNGEAAAKFEDIKVGDTVSGLRLKKSPTEYEVVKITKFGVVAPKMKAAPAAAEPKKKK